MTTQVSRIGNTKPKAPEQLRPADMIEKATKRGLNIHIFRTEFSEQIQVASLPVLSHP